MDEHNLDNCENRIMQLEILKRGDLMKEGSHAGVEDVKSLTNEQLIDDILEKEFGQISKVQVEAKQVMIQPERISGVIFDALKDHHPGSEMHKDHYIRTLPCPVVAKIDLYWHEDLDEVQAYRVDELQGDCQFIYPIAAISLNGSRGVRRNQLMGLLCRCLKSLGLEIRLMGITFQN